ncbi:MAG: HAMP domain-containing protein [Ignavibacteriae bacterium]|nr:HAMP domain-containing protein [Ignavibacteriota bacterium]
MRFSIYNKLVSGFVVVIGLMIAANVYVLWQLNDVTKITSRTFQNDVRSINLAKQLQTILFEEDRHALKFLVSRDTTYFTLYNDQSNLFDQYLDSLYEAAPTNTEVGLIFDLRQRHTWTRKSMMTETTKKQRLSVEQISSQDHPRSDTVEALYAGLNQLIRLNEEEVGASVANVNETMVRSTNVAWLITVGALLVALCVALFITGTIVRPIRALIRGTENIARGVFDPIEVKSRDEMALLAAAVNEMSLKLKQINDMKTEMLHHISHELRTPLQTMLSAQYLLADQKRGTLTPEQMRLVASIKEGVKKLTHFSNQFLDIQKVEHGSMEYSFIRTNILSLLEPAVHDLQIVAAQKEVNVEFSHDTELPDILVDTEKISQVISNLLSNAIKYTDSGGTIRVRATAQKKRLRIDVGDTGAGIPKEDLPRIFTKFYQAKNARKGTGIGLALVKALVEGHHGTVSVESELGAGTTFTIELPAATAEKKETPVESVAPEGMPS